MRTYISGDLRSDDLVFVVAQIKVQMWEEEGLGTRDFPNDEVFVQRFTNITPHGKIFHKHFEKVIVVNSFLELGKLIGGKRLLAEHSPINAIQKGDIVGR